MLPDEHAEFIFKSMKIDLKSIFDKLNEEQIVNYKRELEEAIAVFVQAIFSQNESEVIHDRHLNKDSSGAAVINKYSRDLSGKFSNQAAKDVLEALRHTFHCFSSGGLHLLFTRQENESWHPKIVLNEELKPNDIDTLPENIDLYRGTDFAEFNSKNYGQSWTTDKNTAYNFAFNNYANEYWFKESERVILKTNISRKYVYFSSQSPYYEFEVCIDASKITEVQICTQ